MKKSHFLKSVCAVSYTHLDVYKRQALRGSDLLFSFLACPGEFVAEDSALGKLLRKSVPISLRKERGQNLEPFIATFIASTESKVKNR